MKPFSQTKMASLRKIADLVVTRKGGRIFKRRDKNDIRTTSGGLFIGTDKDPATTGKKKYLQSLLGEKGATLQSVRKKYKTKHPDDFATLAFRREGKPKGFFRKLFKTKGYTRDMDQFTRGSKRPHMKVQMGRAGSRDQHRFYNDVFKAKYAYTYGGMSSQVSGDAQKAYTEKPSVPPPPKAPMQAANKTMNTGNTGMTGSGPARPGNIPPPPQQQAAPGKG